MKNVICRVNCTKFIYKEEKIYKPKYEISYDMKKKIIEIKCIIIYIIT